MLRLSRSRRRLLRCWQDPKWSSIWRAIYPKVSTVDREDAVCIEFACEVDQASIGNLNALVFVLAEDLGDVWQIVGT